MGYVLHHERFKITYNLILAWHKLTSTSTSSKSDFDPIISNKSKKYDAFISYCHDDNKWILEELIPQLETEHQIKCCIHERDFQIGVTVLQNIIDCLDQSQVFITVLSPGYVNSTWCMFELFLAQSRMKQMSNLIVIVKQNIKDVSRLDKRLQVILKLWTYLPWPLAMQGQERNLFWQRLTSCIKVQCIKDE